MKQALPPVAGLLAPLELRASGALLRLLAAGSRDVEIEIAMNLRDPIPSLEGAARWLGGGPVDAAQLRGRPVLVHIWSSTCPACKEQFEALRRWSETFGPRGLQIVGVHARSMPDQKDEDAADQVETAGFEHPIALDAPGAPITRRFEARFVPSYYLFDASGQLRHRMAGYQAVGGTERAIERVVAEAEGAHAPT